MKKTCLPLLSSIDLLYVWLITFNYNVTTVQWTTHSYTYRRSLHTDTHTRISIKWCVRYPAVKSTAEYGVLPFGEKDIHWSLSPDIKEYWCYTPQGLVLDAQMERSRTPWRNLTLATPPHDLLLHWKRRFSCATHHGLLWSAVGRPSLTSLKKSMLTRERVTVNIEQGLNYLCT